MCRLLRLSILLALVLALTSIAAAEPKLSVISPTESETILGTTVKVVVKTSDFELVKAVVPVTEAGKRPDANQPGKGMVHLTLDLLPLAILDQGDTYTFTNVPSGEHQLEVELATNDHSLLSPPVVQVVRFRTVAEQPLPATGAESGAPLLVLLLLASIMIAGGLTLRRKLG
jgi:LPXTG-motif cell wall-anchored protein